MWWHSSNGHLRAQPHAGFLHAQAAFSKCSGRLVQPYATTARLHVACSSPHDLFSAMGRADTGSWHVPLGLPELDTTSLYPQLTQENPEALPASPVRYIAAT